MHSLALSDLGCRGEVMTCEHVGLLAGLSNREKARRNSVGDSRVLATVILIREHKLIC